MPEFDPSDPLGLGFNDPAESTSPTFDSGEDPLGLAHTFSVPAMATVTAPPQPAPTLHNYPPVPKQQAKPAQPAQDPRVLRDKETALRQRKQQLESQLQKKPMTGTDYFTHVVDDGGLRQELSSVHDQLKAIDGQKSKSITSTGRSLATEQKIAGAQNTISNVESQLKKLRDQQAFTGSQGSMQNGEFVHVGNPEIDKQIENLEIQRQAQYRYIAKLQGRTPGQPTIERQVDKQIEQGKQLAAMWERAPFSRAAYQNMLNGGDARVRMKNVDETAASWTAEKATKYVREQTAKILGTPLDMRPTKSPEQVELEQPGRDYANTLKADGSKAITAFTPSPHAKEDFSDRVAAVPAKLYEEISGYDRQEAPYAFAALDFVGGLLSSPYHIAASADLLAENPKAWFSDVPRVMGGFLNSINVLDGQVSGPERFVRALNFVAALEGAKGGILKFRDLVADVPRMTELANKMGWDPKAGQLRDFLKEYAKQIKVEPRSAYTRPEPGLQEPPATPQIPVGPSTFGLDLSALAEGSKSGLPEVPKAKGGGLLRNIPIPNIHDDQQSAGYVQTPFDLFSSDHPVSGMGDNAKPILSTPLAHEVHHISPQSTPLLDSTQATADLRSQGLGEYTPAAEAYPNRGVSVKSSTDFYNAMREVYGLGIKQAKAVTAIAEARANTWAETTGAHPDQWFQTRIAGVERVDLPAGAPANAKGAVSFGLDEKAVIKAFGRQDVSTAVHELGHVFRRDLYTMDPNLLQAAEEWAGVKNGIWEKPHEEAFARGFERYLRDGSAPTPTLKHVFAQFAVWLKHIYQKLRGNEVDKSFVSPEIRAVFDKLLTNEERPVGAAVERGPTVPDGLNLHPDENTAAIKWLQGEGGIPIEQPHPSLFDSQNDLFQAEPKGRRIKIVANTASGEFRPISAKKMQTFIRGNDRSATLSDYSLADLKSMHTFELDGGKIAYALNPKIVDGKPLVDLIGVVNNEAHPTAAKGAAIIGSMLHAIETWDAMGGREKVGPLVLDAWDVHDRLPRRYAEFGFKEVGRSQYDVDAYGEPPQSLKDAWKKDGWKEGEPLPSVVFMEFDDAKVDTKRARSLYLREGSVYEKGSGEIQQQRSAALPTADDAGVGSAGRAGVSASGEGGPELQGIRGGSAAEPDRARPSGSSESPPTPSTREARAEPARPSVATQKLLEDLDAISRLPDKALRRNGVSPAALKSFRKLAADEFGRRPDHVSTDLFQADGGDGAKGMGIADFNRNRANFVAITASELAKGRTERAVYMGLKKSYNLNDWQVKQIKAAHAQYAGLRDAAQMIANGADYGAVAKEFAKNPYLSKGAYKKIFAEAAETAKKPVVTSINAKGERVAVVGGGKVTIPEAMIGDLSKWTDRMLSRMKTEGRWIEQVTKGNKAVYEFLIENREKAVTSMVDERSAWRDQLKSNVGFLIKDREASALTMKFGEGKISLDELKEARPNDFQKIVDADAWFRTQYDELLSRVNATREEFGIKPIPRRDDYYSHFQEEGNLWERLFANTDSRTGGTAADIFGPGGAFKDLFARGGGGRASKGKRNSPFNRFAQQRTGDVTTFDALQAFERYLNPTLSEIHLTEPAVRRRALANALRAKAKDFEVRTDDASWAKVANDANEWAKVIDDHASVLAGQRSSLDLEFDKWTGSVLPRVVRYLQSRVSKARIVGNLRSAIMQTSGLALSVPEFGLANTAKGFMHAALDLVGKGDGVIAKSDFMRRRYSDTSTVRPKFIDKAGKVMSIPMEFIEHTVAEGIWRSAYERALSPHKLLGGLGLDEAAAIKYADKWSERVLAGRARGEQPLFFETQAGKTALQFQLEVGNFLQYLGHELKLDHEGARLSHAQILYRGAKIAVTLWALNGLIEEIVGDTPLPDLIRAFGDVKDIAQSRKSGGEKLLRSAGRLAGEALSATPGGSQISNLVPEQGIGGVDRKKLLGRSEVGQFAGTVPIVGTLNDLFRDPGKTLIRDFLLPIGGGQIIKTLKGVDAVTDSGLSSNLSRHNFLSGALFDTVKSGTRNAKGKRDYTVQDPLDKVRALAFGPSATQAARAHYDQVYQRELRKKTVKKQLPARG